MVACSDYKNVSYAPTVLGTSSGVMVSKLDWQTYTSEFESHWVPHSYGLVLHLSKKLSKLNYYNRFVALGVLAMKKLFHTPQSPKNINIIIIIIIIIISLELFPAAIADGFSLKSE